MPKYRKLHACALDSLDLAAMPDDFTRLTWLMLPLICSRDGTTIDHAGYLRSKLYPLRDDVTIAMITGAVDWYVEHGMIARYQVENRSYLWIPTWEKYQGDCSKEAASTFPAPTPDLLQTYSRVSPEEVPTKSNHAASASASTCASESASVPVDAELAKAHMAWQSARGGAVGHMDAEQITELTDTYTAEWVVEAIKEANRSKQDRLPSIKFVDAILQRWKREGFRAPFDAKKKRDEAIVRDTQDEQAAKLQRDLRSWNLAHGIKEAA